MVRVPQGTLLQVDFSSREMSGLPSQMIPKVGLEEGQLTGSLGLYARLAVGSVWEGAFQVTEPCICQGVCGLCGVKDDLESSLKWMVVLPSSGHLTDCSRQSTVATGLLLYSFFFFFFLKGRVSL